MIWALHYGKQERPLVLAIPDQQFGDRGMFRLHWPDGVVSEMANLTRIREAGRLDARVLNPECKYPGQFKWKPGKAPLEADYIAQNEGAARVAKAQFQNAPASREVATPVEMKAT